MNTTVVTAFYQIKSKFPVEQYLSWIRLFMRADLAVVIFGDEGSLQWLRDTFPETERRRYQLKRLEQFVSSSWSWDADYALDGEKSVGHSVDLYKVWNEKPFFVRDVVRDNPYGTEAFAWVDIGCIREERTLWPMGGFPDARKFDLRKVNLLAIQPFLPEETRDPHLLDERFRQVMRVSGGIFAGGAEALCRFADIHYETIAEAKSRGVFAGKDQNLLAFEALRYPELFNLLSSETRPGFDPWFQLLWRWASDEVVQRQYFGNFFLQKLKVRDHTTAKLEFFAALCRGKRVLHVGCTDYPLFDPQTNLHIKLTSACAVLDGTDTDVQGLEKLRPYCSGKLYPTLELIEDHYDVMLVPEVLEHTTDVGAFLAKLDRVEATRVVITVPSLVGHAMRGAFNYAGVPGRLAQFVQAYGDSSVYVEEVHPDHKAWYSPYTLANTIQQLTPWRLDELWFLEGRTMVAAVCTRRAV